MPAEEGADGDQDETKESVTLAGQRLNRLKPKPQTSIASSAATAKNAHRTK